jgi:hypothetical protein
MSLSKTLHDAREVGAVAFVCFNGIPMPPQEPMQGMGVPVRQLAFCLQPETEGYYACLFIVSLCNAVTASCFYGPSPARRNGPPLYAAHSACPLLLILDGFS